MKTHEGYISSTPKFTELIGKMGNSYTILRPAGKIEIDNTIYDAMAQESYIEKGKSVVVIKYINNQLVVRQQDIPTNELD
jgi:membrane-bound serine protease (ClpP class)